MMVLIPLFWFVTSQIWDVTGLQEIYCGTSANALTYSLNRISLGEVRCAATCEKDERIIWGTRIYTYDSPLCTSALHDFRISRYNTSQRSIVVQYLRSDPGRYYNAIRHGVSSEPYKKLQYSTSGHYFFLSPVIQEAILDVTSLHRGFVYSDNGSSQQECHLGTEATTKTVKFTYFDPRVGSNADVSEGTNEHGKWYTTTWPSARNKLRPGGVVCLPDDNDLSRVTSLTMSRTAHFHADRHTVVANKDGKVRLVFGRGKAGLATLTNIVWWKKDTVPLDQYFYDSYQQREENGYQILEFENAQEGHSGIYSLEYEQSRMDERNVRFGNRGILRLIVRRCSSGKFGEGCQKECPKCENGGVCHDIMGTCICPPGFKGDSCETPCGDNRFGRNCQQLCSTTNPDKSETCKGILFCLPDPYGCSCGTGYRGHDCTESCHVGFYGASCLMKRECHCAKGRPCNPYTGLCDYDCELETCQKICEPGWKGDSCITSYPVLSEKPGFIEAKRTSLTISFRPWNADRDAGEGVPDAYEVQYRKSSGDPDYITAETFPAASLMNETQQEVEIVNLNANSVYDIRVIIVDEDGEAQRDAAEVSSYGTKCGVPKETPKLSTADNSSSTMVYLNWTVPPVKTWRCPQILYGISYNSSQEVSYNRTPENSFTFQSKPYTLWNISLRTETPEDTYSQWGETFQVLTAESAPGPVKDLETVFYETNQTLYVTWKEPEIKNGLIQRYQIELKHLHWLHNCQTTVPIVRLETTERSIFFEEILFSSDYRVFVRALTKYEGIKRPSDFSTHESVPAAPRLLDYHGTNLATGTVYNVGWFPPACELQNGQILNYTVSYQGAEEWANKLNEITTSMKNIMLSDLIPYTNYTVKVRGCTRIGCGNSTQKIIQTLPTNPGVPTNLTAYSKTDTTISLSWKNPFPPLAEITQYSVQFIARQRETRESPSAKEVECEDTVRQNFSCYSLRDLVPLTTYKIMVWAISKEGKSGTSSEEIEVITQESLPDPPGEITLVSRTTTSLFVTWKEPFKTNGIITGYISNLTLIRRFGYNDINQLKQSNVPSTTTSLNYTMLEPTSTYMLSVSASTRVGFGLPRTAILETKNSVPVVDVQPVIGHVRKNSIEISIKPVAFKDGPVSSYLVLVEDNDYRKKRSAEHFQPRSFNESMGKYVAAEFQAKDIAEEGQNLTVGDGKNYGGYYNAPLRTGHRYRVGMAVASNFSNNIEYGVIYADSLILVDDRAPELSAKTGVIVGSLIAILTIATALIFLLWRRNPEYFKFGKKQDNGSLMMYNKQAVNKDSSLSLEGMDIYDDCVVRNSIKCNKMPVHDLDIFVKGAIASGRIKKEFESLPKGPTHASETSRISENKIKNRYGNYLPYDHSRVVLEKVNEEKYSDYINANYVDGQNYPKAFIATQGPKSCTVSDFWQMVWQEGTCKIIMLTNLIEAGKLKCEKYWPDKSEQYGTFRVSLREVVHFSDYVIRTMTLAKDGCEERQIKQFHFTSWPDHGVPMYPLTVYSFMKQISSYEKDSQTPKVVHCSAGVGRTGTIILLFNMFDMGRDSGFVDVLNGLWSIRQQRINLVETYEQYSFVYRTLADILCGGETSILCPQFTEKFKQLSQVDAQTGKSELEIQFERLQRISPTLSFNDCAEGHNSDNGEKNRISDVLPPDSARVILPVTETCKSNYINAVYVNGYKQRDSFIVTQYPLPNTTVDFWRMVVAAKSTTIVLLHELNPAKDQTCQPYWTEDSQISYGDVLVQHKSTENKEFVVYRIFEVLHESLKEPLMVKQFQLKGWAPDKNLPPKPDTILDVMDQVERWQRQSKGKAVVVQCLSGTTGCGVYCASVFLCDKMKNEREVDVYLAVRSVRANRPQFITNPNQYTFLYTVAQVYLDLFEIYANFQ